MPRFRVPALFFASRSHDDADDRFVCQIERAMLRERTGAGLRAAEQQAHYRQAQAAPYFKARLTTAAALHTQNRVLQAPKRHGLRCRPH